MVPGRQSKPCFEAVSCGHESCWFQWEAFYEEMRMSEHSYAQRAAVARNRHLNSRHLLQSILWIGWLAIGVNAWLVSQI